MKGTSNHITALQLYSLPKANTEQIMSYYDSHLESVIDHDNCLAF